VSCIGVHVHVLDGINFSFAISQSKCLCNLHMLVQNIEVHMCPSNMYMGSYPQSLLFGHWSLRQFVILRLGS